MKIIASAIVIETLYENLLGVKTIQNPTRDVSVINLLFVIADF